jgi:hypothetical protein
MPSETEKAIKARRNNILSGRETDQFAQDLFRRLEDGDRWGSRRNANRVVRVQGEHGSLSIDAPDEESIRAAGFLKFLAHTLTIDLIV